MKKIYFLASMLLFGGLAQAQQTSPVMRAATSITNYHTNSGHLTVNHDRAPGDVITPYQDDFSTPGNWILANTGTPSTNFTINTVGPASAPELLQSTSGGNFAWYDCDPQGTGSTVDATLTYGTVCDLSSNLAVVVQFEQFYMDYYEDTYVEVSTNGLAGPWTQYEVNENYLPNAPSPVNPVLTQVNISSQAGGQSMVAIRFHYVGNWGWSWQIDDFALVEAYENELENTWSHFSTGTEGNDYYLVPTNQITEITFGSLIKSNGVVDQTNVQMRADVNGGSEYTQTSMQSVTLTENQVDTFSIESGSGWTPSGAGAYDLVMSAFTNDFTEQFPANNDIVFETITVGGNVYARDNGVISSTFSGFAAYPNDPLQVGNTYEFFADQVFGKVQVRLTSAAANEGQIMYASVYKWNDGLGDFDYVTQSEDHTIANGDLGTFVELDLNDNISALSGEIYLVCAGHYGGTTPVGFGEAQAAESGTVAAIHPSAGTLYSGDPSTLMVRAVFAPSEVGIDEISSATGLNLYPNPADKATLLTYNVVKEGNVALTLTDLSGKVVYTENYGSQVEGQYNVNLSTAALSNGVYFYTLTVGEQSITKKFVVSH